MEVTRVNKPAEAERPVVNVTSDGGRRAEEAAVIAGAVQAAFKSGAVENTDAAPDPTDATAMSEAAVTAETPAADEKPAKSDAKAEPAPVVELAKVEKAKRESLLEIARQERRLNEERKAWKAQQEASRAESEKTAARLRQLEEIESVKGNPLALFEKLGLTPDTVARALLKVPEDKPKTPEEMLAAFKSDLEAKEKAKAEAAEKAQAEARAKAEEQQKQYYKVALDKTKKLVADGGDAYELIREYGAYDKVLRVQEEIYRNGYEEQDVAAGTILTLSKCAKIVEDLIAEDVRAKAQKSKKLAALLAAKQEAAQETKARPSSGEKAKPAPALTNRKATPTATPNDARRAMSEQDALNEAVKKLSWR